MARPRNGETERAILLAAWKLFDNRGYERTSYTDIADESGINRATVQRYFPRKETMLAEALASLRDQCERVALGCWQNVIGRSELLYRLGQIYLAALMSDACSRRLLCDILENRALVERTIGRDLLWSVDYVEHRLGRPGPNVEEGSKMGVIAAMGGLYEVMYYCARNDHAFVPAVWMQDVAHASAELLGMTKQESEELICSCVIDEPKLKVLGAEAYARVFRCL